jgi:hypothetical protein
VARWIPLDTGFQDDDRIASIHRQFGNGGIGVLVMLLAHIGRYGAKPGAAVKSTGEPFELENMARRVRVSVPYLRRFLANCSHSGLIDRQAWEAKGLVLFPHLARKLKAYADQRSGAERAQAHRDRVFDRIAEKCANRCVHCGSGDDLELERIVPKDAGGTNAEENLRLACVPCARQRRADRQAKEGQNVTQDVTERNARTDLIRSDLISVASSTVPGSLEEISDTQSARAREEQQTIPEPSPRLPLVGAVPARVLAHPRVNPALVAPVLDGSTPRDHMRCLAPCGRVCFPLALAEQLARQLGGDPDQAIAMIRTFRDDVLKAIPENQPIGDRPFDFWRAHFAARFASAAPAVKSATSRPGPNPAAGRVLAPAGKYDRINRRDQDATATGVHVRKV